MKITIVHADVKVEYKDHRTVAEINQQYQTQSEISYNVESICKVINSLGELVKILKDEAKEENGGISPV